MSAYTRWQMLNESLGFPLGIKTMASLGISGGFDQLEEKKKKMEVGDEVPADEPEEDDDADDVDSGEEEDKDGEEKGKKLPPWLQKVKGEAGEEKEDPACKHCGERHLGGERFCSKKAKKCMSGKCKMHTEGRYAGYDVDFTPAPEVGTEEFRQSFFQSLEGHMGEPGKRWDGGVNLGEEMLLTPADEPAPAVSSEPVAGEPGFAPMSRVGSPLPPSPEKPAWEQGWTPIAEQMNALIQQWDSVCKNK